jgi:hypothetical protein
MLYIYSEENRQRYHHHYGENPELGTVVGLPASTFLFPLLLNHDTTL